MELPEAFLERMRTQLGDGFDSYRQAMSASARRALRVNTLKLSPEALRTLFPGELLPDGVIPEGFFVPDGYQPSRDPLHMAGLIYMQEPSAQKPASLLPIRPGMRVLDLCAAPGGKAGQLAAMLGNTGLLMANEPVQSRAGVLMHTLERLGVRNAVVASMQPQALCQALPGFFDAVLVDAPCSGEGMFRKDPEAAACWSLEHVRSCSLRQRAILDSAAGAVAGGGALMYSTCTFSPEENEDTVACFLDTHPDFSLAAMERMYPHTSPGEGQFMALLIRAFPGPKAPAPAPVTASPVPKEFSAFWNASLHRPLERARLLADGRVLLLPEQMPPHMDKLHVLRAGILAGELRQKHFVPDHALFMAFSGDSFCQSFQLSDETLPSFVSGQTFACPQTLSGWCALLWQGWPIGFGKAVSGMMKNHLPKGLRVCL